MTEGPSVRTFLSHRNVPGLFLFSFPTNSDFDRSGRDPGHPASVSPRSSDPCLKNEEEGTGTIRSPSPTNPSRIMAPPLVQDASQNMKVAAVVSFYMAAALVVRPTDSLSYQCSSSSSFLRWAHRWFSCT